MFILMLWIFMAAMLFIVTRGVADILQITGVPLVFVWVVAFGLFGAGFTYCDPMAKEQQEAATPSVSAADRRLLGSAMMACDERTRRSVNIPRTLDFKTFQTTRQVLPGRVARIFRGFSAENAFGQTLDFTYYCEYRAGGIQAYSISRR